MKPNSKIISSHGFPGEGFRTEETVVGPTSRSPGTTWVIQTVIPATMSAASMTSRAESPSVAASLMRQEAPRAHRPHRDYAKEKGPLMGATQLPTGGVASDAKSCSLA